MKTSLPYGFQGVVQGVAKSTALGLFTALLAFVPAGCSDRGAERSERSTITRGVPAPAFTLTTFEGDTITLGELKGRPVVINFFASWCTPCAIEAGTLQSLWLAFKDRGVAFIGIASSDTEKDARAFIEKFSITYPSGMDTDGELARAYGIVGLPVTIILDREGLVSFDHLGAIEGKALQKAIRNVF